VDPDRISSTAAEDETTFRPVVGIYRKYARVDCQVEEVLDNADKKIDVCALFAQFESESYFTLIENTLNRALLTLNRLIKRSDEGHFERAGHARDAFKLSLKLSEKRYSFSESERKVRSISVLTPEQCEPTIRDSYIKIGRLFEDFSYLK